MAQAFFNMSKDIQNDSLNEAQTIQNSRVGAGPKRGILLSVASLRLPFCICLDILQKIQFWDRNL